MLKFNTLAVRCLAITGLLCATQANLQPTAAQGSYTRSNAKGQTVVVTEKPVVRRQVGGVNVDVVRQHVPANNIGYPMKPNEQMVEGRDEIPPAVSVPGI